MRTTTLLFCFIFSSIVLAQNKTPVAVMEFKPSGGISGDEASILTNRFRGILVNTDKFEVVEREQMSTILKEQDFTMSDNCNSQECAVQIGQLLGVKQIIAGNIGKLGQTWTIDLRLIDVAKGKIIQSLSRDHKGEIDGLLEVMKSIAATFAGIDERNISSERSNSASGLLNQWDILDGNWYEKDGAIIGSGGFLIQKESMADCLIEVTVEKLSGPSWAMVSVGWRSNIVAGGRKIWKNKTSDNQGYGLNFSFDKKFNLFNGIGGVWYFVFPEWNDFQVSNLFDEKVNRVKIEVKGELSKIFVNDKLLTSFEDKTHGYGAVALWVQEPSQIIKFSNLKITPK